MPVEYVNASIDIRIRCSWCGKTQNATLERRMTDKRGIDMESLKDLVTYQHFYREVIEPSEWIVDEFRLNYFCSRQCDVKHKLKEMGLEGFEICWDEQFPFGSLP